MTNSPMTALNKQALREVANAANIASWGKWESYKPHKGARGYEVKVGTKTVAQHCLKVDSAFIAATNPSTVLAMLDEMEAKDKRIEEEICRANREHHRGFMMACNHLKEHANIHYADAAEMEIAALRQRIAELEARTVTLPQYRNSPDMHTKQFYEAIGFNQGLDIFIEALRAAGIGVKGE